jgi:hypothetical protein
MGPVVFGPEVSRTSTLLVGLVNLAGPKQGEAQMANSKRSFIWLLPLLFLCWQPIGAFAQQRVPNQVEIEFPIGDIEIRHVESDRGMILVVQSATISVKARRLFFGDGEHAVKYESSNFGIKSPQGLVKAGAITIKNGATIETKSTTLEDWADRTDEVYIRLPNLKFETEKQAEPGKAK